jgi:hypothetical protein
MQELIALGGGVLTADEAAIEGAYDVASYGSDGLHVIAPSSQLHRNRDRGPGRGGTRRGQARIERLTMPHRMASHVVWKMRPIAKPYRATSRPDQRCT